MRTKPEGWYPDPITVGAARYWDGSHWTRRVAWGSTSIEDPTALEEVSRREAGQVVAVVGSWLADAEERGEISPVVSAEVREALASVARPCRGPAPQAGLPPVPVPPPSSPARHAGVGLEPPSPVAPGNGSRPAPVPPPPGAPAPPVPVPVQRSILTQWARRAHAAVRTDLALHGLAYLGVLLMFAGVSGLIAFSFGDIASELRTLTELLVPTTFLVAGWYLGRRGATVVSGALIVLGGAFVPLVVVASVTDNAPLPPDLHGRVLPLAQAGLCLALAALMAAVAPRNELARPLRFVAGPVAWIGLGLGTAIWRDPIPAGYETARPDALQLSVVLAAIALVVGVLELRRATGLVATATRAVGWPAAAAFYVVELVLAGNERWPLAASIVGGIAVIVLLELATSRLPAWTVTAAQAAVIGITAARLAVHGEGAWIAAGAAVGAIALLEYAGGRRPTEIGTWAAAGVAALSLVGSAAVPAAGLTGFGVTTLWLLWRRVHAPAWQPVRDSSGVGVAVGALSTQLEAANAFGARPALLGGALLTMAVAVIGRLVPPVRRDLLWRWLVPTAAAGLWLSSMAQPWGERPMLVAAGTLALAVAAAASSLPLGPRTWLTAAMVVWAEANVGEAAGLARDGQALVLSGLALAVVGVSLLPRWSIAPHLTAIGHVGATGAILVSPWFGWPLTAVLGAATAAWLLTGLVNEVRGAAMVEGVRGSFPTTDLPWSSVFDDAPHLIVLAGAATTAAVGADAWGRVLLHDRWAPVIVCAVAAGAALGVRVVPWRRASAVVLAGAAVLLGLGALGGVLADSVAGRNGPAVVALCLGIAAVVVSRAPRPTAFTWVGWAQCAALSAYAADQLGLAVRWADVVVAGWGASVLLSVLLVERVRLGPVVRGSAVLVRRRALRAPGTLGALALVVGGASGLLDGSKAEIGWTAAGLGVPVVVIALLVSSGAVGAVAEALGVLAVVLLAPWEPLERPWSIVVLSLAPLVVAQLTRSERESWWVRWDLPSLVVAHGVVAVALMAAMRGANLALPFILAGSLAIGLAIVRRRVEWAIGGAVLVLVGAADAGPGWLTFALSVEGLALSVGGLLSEGRTRWVLLSVGAAAWLAAWAQVFDWQSWSTPTALYSTSPGAAGVALVAALLVRSRRAPGEAGVVWMVSGAVAALSAMTLVGHPDVTSGAGGSTVAVGLLLLATAAGVAAPTLEASLRWVAVVPAVAAWAPAAWALQLDAEGLALLTTATALVLLAVMLAVQAWRPTMPWVGPAATGGLLTQGVGALAALTVLPDQTVLIVVLLALAGELGALAVLARAPGLFVASPAAACGSWLLYADDSLTGDANWLTVPVGVTLLTMVGLVRWIRRTRGGDVVGIDVLTVELVSMAFVVSSSLARTLAGHLWSGVLAIALGVALATWGAFTQVRRRVSFGAGAVVLAVLLVIAVPLSDVGVWSGAALWVTIIAIGLVAVLAAATIEGSRDRIQQVAHKFDEMTKGWERMR